MKTLYVWVSDEEMREFDIPDDVVPLDLGSFCPHGCKDPHRTGYVFGGALVTIIDSAGWFGCAAGNRHVLPKRRAVVDRHHHVKVVES
jgi:hypothetical protein